MEIHTIYTSFPCHDFIYRYFVCLHCVLTKPEPLKINYRLNTGISSNLRNLINSDTAVRIQCNSVSFLFSFNPLNPPVRIIWEYCNHFSSCSIWLSRQTNPEMLLTVLPFGRQQLVFSSLPQAMTVYCQIGVLCLLFSDGFG